MQPTEQGQGAHPQPEALAEVGDIPPLSERARTFIFSHAVEVTQRLARTLVKEGGSIEEREALVERTYDEVTSVLLGLHPEPKTADDVRFLAGCVKELFSLEDTEENETLIDIFCSDIGGVKFRHADIKEDIEFVHNLLSSVLRIGKFGISYGEGTDKDLDANEEFLTMPPDELTERLRDAKREFFHFV